MGWLSSLFSNDSSQRSRKSQAFTSTHDAFSLPTSSPVFNPHPDAFNPDTLVSPSPLSARTPTAYTYPPQGTIGYGYAPPSSAFGPRPASSSLLPTHMDQLHTPLTSSQGYPPLSKTWARIRSWLNREYPELGDTLNYGILPQELAEIEMQFGFALPSVVRESYLCVDGQEAESAAGCSEGLFFGLTLLPLESVLEEWRFWREVDNDPSTGANDALRQSMQSIPPDWIRREYSQRGWIPLVADKAGNYLGIDLNPAEQGQVGQVIVFGRDFDTKVVLWNGDGLTGWAKWLAAFAEELESGEGFEIGATDASEGSEDEVGYESYFYDGHGRGQGDGGGDTGSGGGLRYTGEYRGWNVLEAWADRSLRRWHEAGVISADIMAPVAEDDDRQELDIVELSMQGPGAVEVAIPVLTETSEAIPRPTPEALGHHSGQAGPSNRTEPVPTISVTKPPAPLPVTLPTASDIAPLPSPPNSAHSSLEDLESGRINGLHGYSEDVGLVSSTRRVGKSKSPIRRETSETTGSALPLSSSPPLLPSTPPKTASPPPIIPDLLADLSPELSTQSFKPLSEVYSEELSKASEMKLDAAEVTPEEEKELDTTIRLVGGGGQSGIVNQNSIVSSPVEEVVEPVPDSDVVSVNSVTSPEVEAKKGEKKHKKNKSSLANLKRLSHLGNKKKSDSTTNLNELVSP
ncbi:KNR4/SMI1-like protein 2 [Psilocybe cubensis]|uniref:Knr4/Smi1-like domain-containing protein n=2 Tax=Psilocybe cubensis TaxID=181762 RepID=A0A8H7Y4U7_PSICU|nr:KNR4/SMI1-like protein 2 [Psilocybe cubensis]KAH9484083.1 KNR4/SMI1-like protein 2 [Psilocybe cubensis]